MALTSPTTAGFHDRRVTARRSSDFPEFRLLRLQDVMSLCAMSRTSIYDAVKQGKFPAPIHVHGRSTRWVSNDVRDWLAARVLQQRTKLERPQ